MAVISAAPEVAKIGKKLIGQFHTHLNGMDIRYVFRDKATKHLGQTVQGTASVKSGLFAMLATGSTNSEGLTVGIITIAGDEWEKLDVAQRHRLVDHELCHLGVEITEGGGRKLVLIPHEIQEFADIWARYGLDESDAAFLERADSEQLRLFIDNL